MAPISIGAKCADSNCIFLPKLLCSFAEHPSEILDGIAIPSAFRYLSLTTNPYFMRYKIQISAPALLSAAVFVLGLFAMLFYSLDVTNRELGSEFRISISLQTTIIYLVSVFLFSFFIFALFRRNRE